jgi:4-hydroxy-tetrahydrodipicolinate synthase
MASDTIREKLKGTGVALVTPFNNDVKKSVDFESYRKLLEHTGKYTDYFVVNGTTAESPTLSQEERNALLAFTKKYNTYQRPIVFGVGRNSTEETIEALQTIDLSGVDAILTVSPYYNKPSQRGLLKHYQLIADASPVPVIVYNVPGRTGSNIEVDTTLQLATYPNIIGIKEASGDLMQCMKIAKNKPNDFLLISGDDMVTTMMMSVGAVGIISVVANAFPKEMSSAVNAALKGDYASATKQIFEIFDITGLLFAEGNPVGVKLALEILGICSAEVRLPLVSGSDKLRKQMETVIQTMKNKL